MRFGAGEHRRVMVALLSHHAQRVGVEGEQRRDHLLAAVGALIAERPREELQLDSIKPLLLALATAIAGFAFTAAPSQAQQNWPTRAVKFIVPFPPGAGADIGARLFAEKLSKTWGPAGGGREPAGRRQYCRHHRVSDGQ